MERILKFFHCYVIVLFLFHCTVRIGHTTEPPGCKVASKDCVSNSTDDRGGIEDMSRLISNLLDGYRQDVLPRVNNSHPVEIKVGIGVNALINLDTRNQMISIRGYLRTIWIDPLLQWKPEDYGNITYVVLSSKAIWMPELALANSIHGSFLTTDSIHVSVDYLGTVDWQPPIVSDFTCEIDVAKFPFDVNTCPIMISAWMHDTPALNLSLMETHTVLGGSVTNGQFMMDVGLPKAESTLYDAKSYSLVTFNLKFSRRPDYALMSLVFPMVVIGLLSPLSFLIPPDSGEKVGVSLNVLLSTTVCVGLVRGDLPDRSDRISSVALYAVSILASAFVSVLGNIVVLLVYRHESSHNQDTSSPVTSAYIPDEDIVDNNCQHERFYSDEQKQRRCYSSHDTEGLSVNPKVNVQGQGFSLGWKLNWIFFAVVSASNCVTMAIVLDMMLL